MIDALIKSLDPLFQNMEWLEVYGGLAETWTKVIDSEGGTREENFPVSMGVNMENCGDECLQTLAPNNDKKAVAFWVTTGDPEISQPKNRSRANGLQQYNQAARLVVWLNFNGCDNCDNTSYLAYATQVINALNRLKVQSTDPVNAAGRIRVIGAPNRNHREIFDAWEFGRYQRLFVYPFDFFAVDCTFEWFVNSVCPIAPAC